MHEDARRQTLLAHPAEAEAMAKAAHALFRVLATPASVRRSVREALIAAAEERPGGDDCAAEDEEEGAAATAAWTEAWTAVAPASCSCASAAGACADQAERPIELA